MAQPNGSRLSCGRLARRRKSSGRQSVPRQRHNTPSPLKRSPPASFTRLLGAAATRTIDLLTPRHNDRLLSPRAQRLRVVEEVGGHLVILHDLPMLAVRSEWAHAARLEVGAIGLVHLQVERVIGDQGEKADRKSTRLNSSHANISYAVFCLKKKKTACLRLARPSFESSNRCSRV